MTKVKIDLLMERYLVTEAPVQLFNPTKEDATAFCSELKSGVKAPYVNVSLGQIGSPDRVYITVGLQPKEKWKNGIFQNSTYFQMHISSDGSMEVFSSNLTVKSKNPMLAYDRIPVKFRKTKAKSTEDAIAKINAFSKQIKDYYASIDLPIEESNEMKIAPILSKIKEEGAKPDIKQALDNYVEKLNQAAVAYDRKQGYTLPSSVFDISPGNRWAKIVTTTMGGKGQRSVFAFVDPETGDIYKPAGWNAPAKGVRGNVTDEKPPLSADELYRYR